MLDLIPIDHDPFAPPAPMTGAQIPPPGYTPSEIAASQSPQLMPVDHDPFAMGHPTSGPSGSLTTDLGREAATAGIRAGLGLISPLVGVGGYGVGRDPNTGRTTLKYQSPAPDKNAAMQQAADSIYNLTGATEYVPQTWLGRRAMDAGTGLAGALMTGNPLSALPAAVGASATGGAAAELFPNHPLAAALLGGIPGAYAGSAAMSLPQRLAAPMLGGPTTEPYGAFQRQGLPTELAGTSTGEPGLVYAEKFAARMPGSEATVADARTRLLTGWQDRLGQVADSLGTAATPQEAGVSLQSAARNWLTDFKAKTGQMWSDFYQKVPQTTPVQVSNYEGALNNVLGNFAGAPASGKVLQPATVRSLSDALGVDLQPGGTLPWEAVKNIRTAIGEKLANPQTIADTSQAALKQIYAGLTRDMEAGAGGVSQDALSSFHRANAATAAGHDLLENHLNPILTAATPERATQYAMAQARLGGSRLGAVTFNLPGAAGDLSSYALRNAATNAQSPTALATALTGRKPIYSQEAQNVLFPQPGTQSDIADLSTIGRALQPLEKDMANSPTATHAARGMGRLFMAAEMGREGHDLAGMPGLVGGAALGAFAPDIMGRAAQVGAVNPYLAALYGRKIPYEPTSPSALARALIGTAAVPRLSAPAPLSLGAPATGAN